MIIRVVSLNSLKKQNYKVNLHLIFIIINVFLVYSFEPINMIKVRNLFGVNNLGIIIILNNN